MFRKFAILMLLSGLCFSLPAFAENTSSNVEVKFVNPIFYKKLIPFSNNERETYLTPTQYKYSNTVPYRENDTYQNGWTTEDCTLIENEQNYIVLSCTFYNPVRERIENSIYKFRIDSCSHSKNEKCSEFLIECNNDGGLSYFAVKTDD